MQKQMDGHTFGREGVREEETTVVVGSLEKRLGYLYKSERRAETSLWDDGLLDGPRTGMRRFGEHL